MVSLALASLAEFKFERQEFSDSIAFASAAVANADHEKGSTYAAYFRVYLADALLADGQVGEAKKNLIEAIPVLRESQMVAETIHALKLLRDVETKILETEARGKGGRE